MGNTAKEIAMKKFMLAKKRKQDMVEKLKKQLTVKYETETGLKANCFFAM